MDENAKRDKTVKEADDKFHQMIAKTREEMRDVLREEGDDAPGDGGDAPQPDQPGNDGPQEDEEGEDAEEQPEEDQPHPTKEEIIKAIDDVEHEIERDSKELE